MNQEKINCFVDSNIWLYAFLKNQDVDKTITSKKLLCDNQSCITVSTQVINEVCFNLRKKTHFLESDLQALVNNFYHRYAVINIEQLTLLSASKLREQYSLSFWDSLVVASALQSGSAILYSEDMQHELVINNTLKIINPFL